MPSSRAVTGVFASAAVIAACSGSDDHRKPPSSDAGTPDGASSGSGGRLGTGGRPGTGGTPSTGGAPATGGTAGIGGTGGSAGVHLDAGADVSVDASDGGPPPFVCRHVTIPDGGTTVDAGASQWRDWALHACTACPGKALACDDLTGTRSFFDRGTRVLTITVGASTAEVVAGTVSVQWDAILDDGGYAYGTATSALSIDENTLTADLSSQIPKNIVSLNQIRAELDDACGQHSSVDPFYYASRDSDGGPGITITCEQ